MRFNQRARKERIKNKIVLAFGLAFLLGIGVYFLLRDVYTWVPMIIPEFLGVSLLAILITFALKKNTLFAVYMIVLFGILCLGVIGFIYGRFNNIRFLVDLCPELLGSTGLSLVFSLIFRKRIWQ